MVPNNPLLPKTAAKRKNKRNVWCIWLQQAGLLQADAPKRKHCHKGRNHCWANKKETGDMETGQWPKPAPMPVAGTKKTQHKNRQG